MTLIPEGLVLLMSVTFAVAAVRLAKQNTLVQQMAATESLAAVDTICVDKTGTLTDGELELVEIVPADGAEVAAAERALGRFAASAGERNRTLQVIADRFRARPERPVAEVPFSSVWKWSRHDAQRRLRRDVQLRDGRARHPDRATARSSSRPTCRRALDEHTAAGRRVVAFAEAPGALPSDPASEPPPRCGRRRWSCSEERLRPDAAGDDRRSCASSRSI